MPQMKHSTHSITLEVSYAKAYDYLSDWRNQPDWAVNFVKGIRQENNRIIMTTPNGDVPIQWRTNRELGTIDMVFPGDSVLPTRITAIGDSLVYTFTFSVPSDMPDEVFRHAQENMEEELKVLKSILET
ncbi:MAG: SRPBCC family protein [Anaerolineae bacterium]|nr:SRPBCC family protein [Anaerolineae bacterium]